MATRRWALDPETRWQRLNKLMEQHAGLLGRQGCLSSRLASGRRVWSLRFVIEVNGQRIHRAAYLGDDPELLHRVRAKLVLQRDRPNWRFETAGFCRFMRLLAKAGQCAP